MNQNNHTETQLDSNFFNIVISLSQSAFVGLGKITNPHTGKVEKNLELARINIDILQMLKDKTKGNLTDKERELISDTLMNLQLNYAEEKKKEAEESKDITDPESGDKEHDTGTENESKG